MAVLDPYRTLGLAPGASADEVKAAYRRLAKLYHPDSAGPAVVARFIEIQDAYDMLTSGRMARTFVRPRPAARPTARQRPSSGGPATDGSAGAERRRTERPQTERPRTERPRSERARPDRPPGPSGAERPRGGRRKATLGSTSYDEAGSGSLDPGWTGASWYGTDSGTYWTVNPREYADPRKHGPEYQERARRARADGRPAASTDPAASTGPAASTDPALDADWQPAPTWSASDAAGRPEHGEPVPAGPPYPGILAATVAILGTVLVIVTIFALFART
jgi:hypothetical protein